MVNSDEWWLIMVDPAVNESPPMAYELPDDLPLRGVIKSSTSDLKVVDNCS